VRTVPSVGTYFGPGLGGLCGVAGVALQGVEGGALAALVGYFIGKTGQSVLRTLAGDRTG